MTGDLAIRPPTCNAGKAHGPLLNRLFAVPVLADRHVVADLSLVGRMCQIWQA
jgi:hypothetical protein